MKKTFPCPACVRHGLNPWSPGDSVDMGGDDCGPIMVQISPDTSCGCCDGDGFIEVGSEDHFYIKCGSLYDRIHKVFGEIDECLPEADFKKFWNGIEQSFMSIKTKWLEANRQEQEGEDYELSGSRSS